MNYSTTTSWKQNMAFETQIGSHKVMTDAPKEAGGDDKAASPKKLMMASLAGCTGVDVVEILKKMRIKIDDLLITVDAELTEDVPSLYKSMHITFEFKGDSLPLDKLKHAVELSQNKYCGVSMMYKKIMDISWEIRYHQ